jgi:hypothetical protein
MAIIPDGLLGSLFTTMFVRYNHNPFILNMPAVPIPVFPYLLLHFVHAPINKLQLFLLYFFRIVKERNDFIDQIVIKPKSLSVFYLRSSP